MNKDVIKFITSFRALIKQGKCEFQNRIYSDGRTYVQVLLDDFGISVADAIDELKTLNHSNYYDDGKPNYYNGIESFTFKKVVRGVNAYIKLKIELRNNNEKVIIISFHKDSVK